MQAIPELKKALEQLLCDEDFIANAASYTRSAFECYYSLPQSSPHTTPSAYLLIIAHLLSNQQPFDYILGSLPEASQESVMQVCKQFMVERREELYEGYLEPGCLYDVKWRMFIEFARQMWEVELYIWGMPQPVTLRLNYEQLSLLAFKVQQMVSHISSIDVDEQDK